MTVCALFIFICHKLIYPARQAGALTNKDTESEAEKDDDYEDFPIFSTIFIAFPFPKEKEEEVEEAESKL